MSESRKVRWRWNGGSRVKRTSLPLGATLVALALFCTAGSVASATASVGFYMAGEASAEKAKQPRFEAESYPATINGAALSPNIFTVDGKIVGCNTSVLTGAVSSVTTTLSLLPSYGGCSTHVLGVPYPAQVRANGCEYVLGALNVGPPYAGDFGIKCPAGKLFEIEIKSPSGEFWCKFAFAPQTGAKSIDFVNTGTGSNRAVDTTFNLKGLKYTVTSNTKVCVPGERENGAYVAEQLLIGS